MKARGKGKGRSTRGLSKNHGCKSTTADTRKPEERRLFFKSLPFRVVFLKSQEQNVQWNSLEDMERPRSVVAHACNPGTKAGKALHFKVSLGYTAS